jgi:hypothetical protein
MATTAAEHTEAPAAAPRPQKMVGEWFWRFLAVVMLITVGWVLWIIYQINPQPLVTKAGFEAAARARASQDAKGVITHPAPAPAAAAAAAPAPDASLQAEAPKPPAQVSPPAAKEPPVNVERLRLADSIETPIPERGAKK